MRDRAPSRDGCGLWIDEHFYDAGSDVESNYTDSPRTHEDRIAEYVFAGSRLNYVGDQPYHYIAGTNLDQLQHRSKQLPGRPVLHA